MSLRRLRRRSGVLSLVLLLASLRGLPHLETDDVACLPLVEEHDETQAALLPAMAGVADHCDVCHLTRSLRAPRVWLAVWSAEIVPSRFAPLDTRLIVRATVHRDLPARAPPFPS